MQVFNKNHYVLKNRKNSYFYRNFSHSVSCQLDIWLSIVRKSYKVQQNSPNLCDSAQCTSLLYVQMAALGMILLLWVPQLPIACQLFFGVNLSHGIFHVVVLHKKFHRNNDYLFPYCKFLSQLSILLFVEFLCFDGLQNQRTPISFCKTALAAVPAASVAATASAAVTVAAVASAVVAASAAAAAVAQHHQQQNQHKYSSSRRSEKQKRPKRPHKKRLDVYFLLKTPSKKSLTDWLDDALSPL